MAGSENYGTGLAKRILAAAQKGEAVPQQVQESAKRTYLGNGRPSDIGIMQEYMGERRSGARKLKRVAGGIRLLGHSIESVSREAAILSSGQKSPVDQARFVSTVLGEVERYTKTKVVKDVAVSAAEMLGKSPRMAARFMNAFRGALRLGGAAALVASAGVEIAEHYFASANQDGRARSRGIDVGQSLNIDPRARRAAEEAQRARYARDAGGIRKLYDYFFEGAKETEITEQTEQQLMLKAGARRHAKTLGVDVPGVLAREAKRKGKSVFELTDGERAQAIDEAMGARISSRQIHDESQVQAQLDREFGGFFQGALNLARDSRHIGSFGLLKSTDDLRRAREEELRTLFTGKTLEALDHRIKDRAEKLARWRAVGVYPDSMSPAQALAERRRQQFAQAGARSFRSRHQFHMSD